MHPNLAILRQNSVFWSKLGYCYDPPRFDADGNVILFADDFDRFTRIQEDFRRSGIRIFSAILFSGWVGVDHYDYELTDRVLQAAFEKTPDAYYIYGYVLECHNAAYSCRPKPFGAPCLMSGRTAPRRLN